MIGKRDPLEMVINRLPMVEDEMLCLSCRQPYTVVRRIGQDCKGRPCPTCGERNAELESEAAAQYSPLH